MRAPDQYLCDGSEQVHGLIESDEQELTIHVRSSEIGTKKSYFLIEIEDGVPLSFSVEATFIGPTVKIIEPNIDFGLMKIDHKQQFRLNVENLSGIDAPIMLKNAKDMETCFEMAEEESRPVVTANGNVYTFEPAYQIVPANDKAEIIVTVDCLKEERIDDILELMVLNSQSEFVYLKANIQEPKICLNRYGMNLGTIYAGIQETIRPGDDNSITLKNYGSIPVQF